jgi:hypothetical protein
VRFSRRRTTPVQKARYDITVRVGPIPEDEHDAVVDAIVRAVRSERGRYDR